MELGSAGPITGQRGPDGPIKTIADIMRFFDSTDMNVLIERNLWRKNVFVHEMGHVLGVGTLWRAMDSTAS